MRDPKTGKSRQYGFVKFTKDCAAAKAIAELNGYSIGDKEVRTVLCTVLYRTGNGAVSTCIQYMFTCLRDSPGRSSHIYPQIKVSYAHDKQKATRISKLLLKNIPLGCTEEEVAVLLAKVIIDSIT